MTAVAQAAEILAAGVVTSLGLDLASAAAAVRGGVSRVRESTLRGKHLEALRLALVPEDALPPLAVGVPTASRTAAHRRMVRLAGLALQQVAPATAAVPPSLFLGVPEARPGADDAVGPQLLADLAVQAGGGFDPQRSAVRRDGGAAGLFALCDALALLQAGKAELALVGAVDTFLDQRRLAELVLEGRILGPRVTDGFIPGEGAAVLLLGTADFARRARLSPLARVRAAAAGEEPGHRYAAEPYRGEGLATTVRALFKAAGETPRIGCVYAGLNGESFPAKEWGVACIRSQDRLADDFQLEHPADCLGDTGAAAGVIMLALAAHALRRGHRRSPCVVWCTSDRAPRAAALLEAVQ